MPISDRTLRLANGLTLRCLCNPAWTTFAGALDLGVGWADDPPALPGLAHLVARLHGVPPLEALAPSGVAWSWACALSDTFLSLAGHPSHLDEALGAWSAALAPRPVGQEAIRAALASMQGEGWHRAGAVRDVVLDRVRAQLLGDPALARERFEDHAHLARLGPLAIADYHARAWAPGAARLTLLAPEPQEALLARVVDKLGALPERGTGVAPRSALDPVVKPLVSRFVSDGTWAMVMVLHALPNALSAEAAMLLRTLISQALARIAGEARSGLAAPDSQVHYVGARATFESWIYAESKRVVHGLEALLTVLEGLRRQLPDDDALAAARRSNIEWLEMIEGSPSELCSLIAGQGMRQAQVWDGDLSRLRERIAALPAVELGAAAQSILAAPRSVVLVGPMQLFSGWRARRLLRRA